MLRCNDDTYTLESCFGTSKGFKAVFFDLPYHLDFIGAYGTIATAQCYQPIRFTIQLLTEHEGCCCL